VDRIEAEAPWNDIHRYIHTAKHTIGKAFFERFVKAESIEKVKHLLTGEAKSNVTSENPLPMPVADTQGTKPAN